MVESWLLLPFPRTSMNCNLTCPKGLLYIESKKEKLLPSSSLPIHLLTTMGKLAPYLILTLTLLLTTLPTRGGAFASMEPQATIQYLPIGTVQNRSVDGVSAMDGDVDRRELNPFQLCLKCRCCTANDLSNCTSMPCCFDIDCDLPDKPYGVCAFVPKICSCNSCS
ncbi:uncharacterized protein LOC103705908 isoform X2 [Phoenix dactylifera]|uniref:Uncharacterized protein LOC103705908 isoform X2 n=1 Tax=Phoenix dactylifera TaxID=42345 RepID=A0A8B7BYI1_PHODC|nr:uncharacterized protein LOC103705908 isoform X2 [Phoenix dactylifera]